jgi:photosystem II stability/assembly factor-like uncharacterized protein
MKLTRFAVVIAILLLATTAALARKAVLRDNGPRRPVVQQQLPALPSPLFANPAATLPAQMSLRPDIFTSRPATSPREPVISRDNPNTLGWVQQTSGVTAQLASAKAVSQTVAWLAGDAGTVVRTIDGGATFTSVGGGAITTEDIYAIEAIDANTALVTTTPGATKIYRTTDGGASWTMVYTNASGFIDALHMFDANNGIAMGDPVAGAWVILKTTNGGATWTPTGTEPPQGGGSEAGWNNSMWAIGNTVWFGTNNSRVYRSVDGGTTWTYTATTIPNTVSVAFVDATHGILGGNSGELARTTDGGISWIDMTSPGGTSSIGGAASSGTRDFWISQGSIVYHSGDRGVQWDSAYTNVTSTGTAATLYHLNFATYGDSTSGWTAGASGTIAAYQNAVTPPPPANDIRPSVILQPLSHTKHHAAFAPSARFFNAGSASQSNIPVRFQILNPTGTVIYNTTSTITGPLAIEQETDVTFSSFTIPGTAGAYIARAISQNADAVPTNDTLEVTFYIPNNLSGTYTVGAGGQIATFEAMCDTLSRNDVAGPVTFSLISSLYSEVPMTIENVSYASTPQVVTIKPAPGVSPNIKAQGTASEGFVLSIVNSDNIVIDGSNAVGGTSLDMILESDTTAANFTTALELTNVKNFTLKNAIVRGFYGPGVGAASAINIQTSGGAYNKDLLFENLQMSRAFYAIIQNGSSTTTPDSNITVRNSTFGLVLGRPVYVCAIALQTVYNAQVYGNIINGVNFGSPFTAAGNVYGILISNATHSSAHHNKVSNIANTSASANAFRVAGITISGTGLGTSANSVSNNMVWDVRTLSTSTDASIQGIWATSGAGDSVYYNSVYLNGSTSVVLASSAFQLGTSSCAVYNNVFFNNRTDGGRTIGIFKNSTDVTSVLNSNNNAIFTPTTTGFVGAVTTTNYATLFGAGSWNAATGQDGASRLGNPRFLSSTDLHINPAIRTCVEAGGFAIPGVDIDGNVRNATTPDIGADEGSFLPQIANDMQTLTIDNPVAGITKKAGIPFAATATFTNTGSASQSAVPVRYRVYTAADPVTPVVDLTASIATLASGSVSQVVFTPNVTLATPGNYVAKAIAELSTDGDRTSDTVTLAFKVKAPLAGTYNIPSAEFATIPEAVADLKAVGVSAPATFLLANQTFTYTDPITIDTIGGVNATNIVTFKPAPGATPTIIGDIANNALIIFNGCDWVTFDGSNTVGGTTRDLTVRNITQNTSGTGGPVFWLRATGLTGVAGVQHVTIKNCNISGGVDQNAGVNTIYGILSCGAVLALPPNVGAGNDTNTFTNNKITKVRIGIWIHGYTVGGNKANVVTNNIIGPTSFGADEIGRAGVILEYQSGYTVSGNDIGYIGGDLANTPANPASGTIDRVGIGIGSDAWPATATLCTIGTITKNRIHHIIDERGNSAVGIILAGSGTSNSTIANNMIYQVRSNSATAGKQGLGIGIMQGSGDKVVYNSISMNGDIDPGAATTATQSMVGIRVASTTPANLTIKDNAIAMDVTSNTATLKHYAIVAAAATHNWGVGGSNYNVLYANPANTQMSVGGIGTTVPYTDKVTLSAWQTTFTINQDVNSYATDPVFTGNADLHITSSASPASNSGTVIAGVTDDIDGDARSASTPDIGADEFTASAANINIAYAAGWNLISNPVTNPVPGDSVRQMFPTSLNPYAFEFAGGYVQKYRLANGKGYWEKFPSAGTQAVTGTPRTRDSMSVAAGWNIVGSISNTVDTNTIVSVPAGLKASNWFGYSGGYTPVTQIISGKGYWIKSTGTGKFVMANPPAGAPAKESGNVVAAESALHSITVTDKLGRTQTLYFGADPDRLVPVALYDMPPVPPAGAFDARFESSEGGTMAKTHAGVTTDPVQYAIAIQSDAYPLTITWKVNGGSASYELADGQDGKVFRAKEMTGDGSITISNASVNKLLVKLVGDGQLPKEYALSQNYPNPFNPSTSVKYALPVDSRVTMEIYNVIGQRVNSLMGGDQPAGYHSIEWNGLGSHGQQLASGVYFLQMTAKGVNGATFTQLRKMMLMK